MNYNDAAGMLAEYRNQIAGIREKMRNAQASIEPEEVKDYEFVTPQGKARLSTLFGDKDTLFIIHNMGTSCVNCTMGRWLQWCVRAFARSSGFRGVVSGHARATEAFRGQSRPPLARAQRGNCTIISRRFSCATC
jgi:predicted dithiol-disulfide oxidoreductase (DUF899 family)